MNRPSRRIGLIGIGAMGWPMAARLRAAGHDLAIYDIDADRVAGFLAEFGGTGAATPAAAAQTADLVITMLPNSSIVRSVLTGNSGALTTLPSGSVVVEMSSGIPAETVRLAELVGAAGGHLVDAPVSGGVPRAETGELTIMLGGAVEAVARVEPVLRHLGTALLRTGPVGSGHAMKALNNLVSAGGFLIGVEALAIGRKFGLDPTTMVDVLNASTGMNNSTQKKFKQYVISRSFDSGFRLDLMVKDLTIALGLAVDGQAAVPFASLCKALWEGGLNAGLGPDHTAIAQLAERLAGCEIG
ncbi:MAG: NAD(P)-dependent oxidoreductase [Geminicoccaceae bacterium]